MAEAPKDKDLEAKLKEYELLLIVAYYPYGFDSPFIEASSYGYSTTSILDKIGMPFRKLKDETGLMALRRHIEELEKELELQIGQVRDKRNFERYSEMLTRINEVLKFPFSYIKMKPKGKRAL
ncbi:MAG TPA: hypothetical protein VJH20_02990 [Candidatus Nanoarchaeia archaeon]|nr:hypothetical protein [Candidatus Nanoarchaeia archaeon]